MTDQKLMDHKMLPFNLPIAYLTDKHTLSEHIKTDLELVSSKGEKTLYDTVFQPTTIYGKQTMPLWAEYYTANEDFIKDSQRLIKGLSVKGERINRDSKHTDSNHTDSNQLEVDTIWQEIQTETGFIEKYNYVDWQRFKIFNNNSTFLQLLSMYHMTSPLISLAIPIFFLIFPFIILKLKGIPLSISKYIEILKTLFKQHQLGQIFTIGSASWDKVIYIVASFGFYILQVYQNITSCIKYYYNMNKIHSQLFTMRDYAKDTLSNMAWFQEVSKGKGNGKDNNELKTYVPFFSHMAQHKEVLERMVKEFDQVVPNCVSFKKLRQIGHVMKCFYQLYNRSEYHETLEYSFGFNGYLDNLIGLSGRLKTKQINPCKIIRREKGVNYKKNIHTNFTDAYFPALVDAKPVKNSYALKKHAIITGPNAAGKTTLLKTTIFNIILSQQTGFGFYKKANILLYEYIHCYINIPDTSGRDSLFQAEARRCKEILDCLTESTIQDRDKQHLCVFDELYSGTNPYEAIGSAYAFLSYLNKKDNVNFVLTTHFLDLCNRLDKQPNINNYHMEVLEEEKSKGKHNDKHDSKDSDFKYTYKLKKNISTIKGGVKVLRDLDYPTEIINDTVEIIKTITHF